MSDSCRGRSAPRIACLCATRRGTLFLERLIELTPGSELLVVTFPEEPGEPRFVDDIRMLAARAGAEFAVAPHVGHQRHGALWESPPDLLFAISWRYLVPSRVYGKARRGAFVFHDSVLPEYRGFAPTVWAIINGEDHTGVTVFEMAEEIDSGAIVDQRIVPVGPHDTIGEVMERVTATYLELLDANLDRLLAGTAPRRGQSHHAATYACKRVPGDNRIDWAAPSRVIHNLVRAVTLPYGGAITTLDGTPMRVWEARLLPDFPPYVGRVPGRVVSVQPGVGTVVLTGDGAILLTRVQLDGDVVCAADLLTSLAHTVGR